MPRRATRRRRRARRRGRTGNWTRGPLWTQTTRNDGPERAAVGGAESTARLLTGDPEAPGTLGGARSFGLLRGRLGGGRRSSGKLHVGHLQARDGVLDRRQLLAVARLEHRQQRASALDGLAGLLEIAVRGLLPRLGGQAGLARAE